VHWNPLENGDKTHKLFYHFNNSKNCQQLKVTILGKPSYFMFVWHLFYTQLCTQVYSTCRIGSIESNSKIECRNFRNIIFFKKELIQGKGNIIEYFRNKHMPNHTFPKKLIIRQMGANLALLVRPTGTIFVIHWMQLSICMFTWIQNTCIPYLIT
jgi:hypothetical protein